MKFQSPGSPKRETFGTVWGYSAALFCSPWPWPQRLRAPGRGHLAGEWAVGGDGRGAGADHVPLQQPMGCGGGRAARGEARIALASTWDGRNAQQLVWATAPGWLVPATWSRPRHGGGILAQPRGRPGGQGEGRGEGAARLCLQVSAEVTGGVGARACARETRPAGQRLHPPFPLVSALRGSGRPGGLRRGLSALLEGRMSIVWNGGKVEESFDAIYRGGRKLFRGGLFRWSTLGISVVSSVMIEQMSAFISHALWWIHVYVLLSTLGVKNIAGSW